MARSLVIAALGFLALPASAAEPVSAPIRLVRELLRVPESELNIGDAALRLSTLVDADADLAEGRARLDGLAKRVAVLVGGRTDPDFRIRAINTVLFREGEYGFDKSDMMGVKPENATLWGLLSRRKGNCVSLPLLWFAVAERLKYPVFAVGAPQHFFLRYDDGSFRQNIEATSGGGSPSDDRIVHELEVPEAAIKSGAMMRSLSKRQFLLELISNAAALELAARNLGTAEAWLTAVVEADSRNLGAHYNLALLLSAQAALATSVKANSPTTEKALLARQEALAAAALSHAKIATSLGAVAPMTEAYWLKVSRVAGTEAGGLKDPPKPFDLAKLLQPGGRPVTVNVTAQYAAPPFPDDQNWRRKCSQACGPPPGNLCSELRFQGPPDPFASPVPRNFPGPDTGGTAQPRRADERVVTEEGLQ